jgi:hypothetical protein
MTGLTENGKSINVIRKVLPRKSNLAIAQAAITPNTRLSVTEIAATSSVSLIADSASGSASAATYDEMPLEKACANTTTSGSTTNTVRKVTASAMMMKRTGPGSVRESRRDAIGRASLREVGGTTSRSAVGA